MPARKPKSPERAALAGNVARVAQRLHLAVSQDVDEIGAAVDAVAASPAAPEQAEAAAAP